MSVAIRLSSLKLASALLQGFALVAKPGAEQTQGQRAAAAILRLILE